MIAAKKLALQLATPPFGLGEVLYSPTDDRGIIQAYNYVVHRVANFGAEELSGKPHKIIRHPDMPRGGCPLRGWLSFCPYQA